jgi:hypothetical protein
MSQELPQFVGMGDVARDVLIVRIGQEAYYRSRCLGIDRQASRRRARRRPTFHPAADAIAIS